MATSFEGKYGRIRYWLKAEIDKPWGFNSKTKRAFTVIDHIDINTQSLLVSNTLASATVACIVRAPSINVTYDYHNNNSMNHIVTSDSCTPLAGKYGHSVQILCY